MPEGANVLIKMGCGHVTTLRNHKAHEQIPMIHYCLECGDGQVVVDHVSAARERDPAGKA